MPFNQSLSSARGLGGGLIPGIPPVPAGTVFRFTSSTTSTLSPGNYYLMLIGGGTGGTMGANAGSCCDFPSTQAGAGGASGRVLNVGPVFLSGGESITIGAQGNTNGGGLQAGNAGGHTTYGNFTSANGTAANGGGPATNNSGFRQGGSGSATVATTAPLVLGNNFGFSTTSTTGGGGGGGWNWAIGGAGGSGGGSGSANTAIGRGGNGGASTGGEPSSSTRAGDGVGFGFGGGGGGGAGNGQNYVMQASPGGPGVVYAIKA